jgi:hypothetical protein
MSSGKRHLTKCSQHLNARLRLFHMDVKSLFVLMGYLLHSGDPKILWLRTARFARRAGKAGPPFALEASGALCPRAMAFFLRHVASRDAQSGRHGRPRPFRRPSTAGRPATATTTRSGYLSEVNTPMSLFVLVLIRPLIFLSNYSSIRKILLRVS